MQATCRHLAQTAQWRAALQILQRFANIDRGDGDVLAGNGGAYLGAALERNMCHLYTGTALKHQHRQVIVRANTGSTHRRQFGIGLSVGLQLGQGLDRVFGMNAKGTRIVDHVTEWLEALQSPRRFAFDRNRHHGWCVDKTDGVAVWLCRSNRAKANVAAGARSINDGESRAITQILLDKRNDASRDDVCAATGGIGQDQVDRLFWPSGGRWRRDAQRNADACDGAGSHSAKCYETAS